MKEATLLVFHLFNFKPSFLLSSHLNNTVLISMGPLNRRYHYEYILKISLKSRIVKYPYAQEELSFDGVWHGLIIKTPNVNVVFIGVQ
jgi:hypothetical protein